MTGASLLEKSIQVLHNRAIIYQKRNCQLPQPITMPTCSMYGMFTYIGRFSSYLLAKGDQKDLYVCVIWFYLRYMYVCVCIFILVDMFGYANISWIPKKCLGPKIMPLPRHVAPPIMSRRRSVKISVDPQVENIPSDSELPIIIG